MWKSARIIIAVLMITGISYFTSITSLHAWDMSDVTLDIPVYVTPLVAPTVTNDGGASSVGSTTARLNGEVTSTGNENPTAIVYYGLTDGGTDAGAWDDNVTLGVKALGTFYYDASGLSETTLYYYRMYASNAGGEDWADSSANFTTIEQCEAPTGLTLTDLGYVTVTANWTPGLGTTYTMLRGLRSGYPTSITDGELIYYGDASSVNSTGYALDVSAYYVSAWGFLADNVTSSSSYATATIGGESMTEVATAIGTISTAIAAFTAYLPSLITLILLIGLAVFAFWHRDKILLIISGLLFVVYGFDYWTTSQLFSIGFVVTGVAIFIKAFITSKAKGAG